MLIFVVRSKEWAAELEVLFWINAPENEKFIKSRVSKLAKKKLAEEKILLSECLVQSYIL